MPLNYMETGSLLLSKVSVKSPVLCTGLFDQITLCREAVLRSWAARRI